MFLWQWPQGAENANQTEDCHASNWTVRII